MARPPHAHLRRRRRAHPCNTDYSCLDGDCPSFLSDQVARTPPAPPAEPALAAGADLFLTGVGGTGIVTVHQLLATAALRRNLDTSGLSGLDQVGLSQPTSASSSASCRPPTPPRSRG